MPFLICSQARRRLFASSCDAKVGLRVGKEGVNLGLQAGSFGTSSQQFSRS